MKIKQHILVLVLIFVFAGAFAQGGSYAFKVLVSKGKSEVKAGSEWKDIKVGASLEAGDEIKISPNSYLGLLHASGKPIEVKEPGNHSVATLAKQVGKEKSVLNKYTDFILSSDDSKKNRLSATGAVHRGDPIPITLYLPESPQEKVFGDRIVLNWSAAANAAGYIVIFKTLFEEELARFEAESTSLEVDLNQKELTGNKVYKVKVLSKANPSITSAEFAVSRLSGKESDTIKKEIGELSDNLDEDTAFGKFYMAGVYEQKLLLINAITAYQDAIRLEPEVDYYQVAYKDFLKRMGFKPEQ